MLSAGVGGPPSMFVDGGPVPNVAGWWWLLFEERSHIMDLYNEGNFFLLTQDLCEGM